MLRLDVGAPAALQGGSWSCIGQGTRLSALAHAKPPHALSARCLDTTDCVQSLHACVPAVPAAASCAGVLAVVRSNSDPYAPPYTGMVPIISGEVAEDLANYLVRQRPAVSGRHMDCIILAMCTQLERIHLHKE